MLFPRFAQSAAALVLLTIGLAAPAHAQNNKQIISGTWYEDRAVGNNSSPNFLLLNFTQTPANQFLNITNVSCNVTVPSAAVINAVTLIAGSTSGAENLGRPYEIKGNVTPETSGSSKYYSIVQNGIFYKFGPGRFPTIEIDAQSTSALSIGAIGANCVIVGNLTEN